MNSSIHYINSTPNQSIIDVPTLTPVYIPSNYQSAIQHPQHPQHPNKYNTCALQKEHIKLLQNIKDKAFVTSILCSKSCAFFSWIKTLINVPLILSSGAMTILNSMNDINTIEIKYANIVLNSCTVTILSLIGNFKLAERELSFRQAQIKMDKLYHNIEDKLLIDPSNCNIEDVRDIIKEYIIIYEHLEYPIPDFIRERFKNGKTSTTVTHTSPQLNVDLTLFDKNNKVNYMNMMNTMMYNTHPATYPVTYPVTYPAAAATYPATATTYPAKYPAAATTYPAKYPATAASYPATAASYPYASYLEAADAAYQGITNTDDTDFRKKMMSTTHSIYPK